LALILALTFVGFSASTARATPPVMGEFDAGGSYIFEGLCDFPLDVMSQYHVHWTDFFDKDGNFVKEVWHGVQTDTFSANGKTLESLPFHWNISFAADDPMGLGVGVLEQVPLPDGGLFISAGQVYFGNEAVFVPDRGAFVNLEGFCAALAP
jgi:hypothetical protein